MNDKELHDYLHSMNKKSAGNWLQGYTGETETA